MLSTTSAQSAQASSSAISVKYKKIQLRPDDQDFLVCNNLEGLVCLTLAEDFVSKYTLSEEKYLDEAFEFSKELSCLMNIEHYFSIDSLNSLQANEGHLLEITLKDNDKTKYSVLAEDFVKFFNEVFASKGITLSYDQEDREIKTHYTAQFHDTCIKFAEPYMSLVDLSVKLKEVAEEVKVKPVYQRVSFADNPVAMSNWQGLTEINVEESVLVSVNKKKLNPTARLNKLLLKSKEKEYIDGLYSTLGWNTIGEQVVEDYIKVKLSFSDVYIEEESFIRTNDFLAVFNQKFLNIGISLTHKEGDANFSIKFDPKFNFSCLTEKPENDFKALSLALMAKKIKVPVLVRKIKQKFDNIKNTDEEKKETVELKNKVNKKRKSKRSVRKEVLASVSEATAANTLISVSSSSQEVFTQFSERERDIRGLDVKLINPSILEKFLNTFRQSFLVKDEGDKRSSLAAFSFIVWQVLRSKNTSDFTLRQKIEMMQGFLEEQKEAFGVNYEKISCAFFKILNSFDEYGEGCLPKEIGIHREIFVLHINNKQVFYGLTSINIDLGSYSKVCNLLGEDEDFYQELFNRSEEGLYLNKIAQGLGFNDLNIAINPKIPTVNINARNIPVGTFINSFNAVFSSQGIELTYQQGASHIEMKLSDVLKIHSELSEAEIEQNISLYTEKFISNLNNLDDIPIQMNIPGSSQTEEESSCSSTDDEMNLVEEMEDFNQEKRKKIFQEKFLIWSNVFTQPKSIINQPEAEHFMRGLFFILLSVTVYMEVQAGSSQVAIDRITQIQKVLSQNPNTSELYKSMLSHSQAVSMALNFVARFSPKIARDEIYLNLRMACNLSPNMEDFANSSILETVKINVSNFGLPSEWTKFSYLNIDLKYYNNIIDTTKLHDLVRHSKEAIYLEKIRKALSVERITAPVIEGCIDFDGKKIQAQTFVATFNEFFSNKGLTLSYKAGDTTLCLILAENLNESCFEPSDVTSNMVSSFKDQLNVGQAFLGDFKMLMQKIDSTEQHVSGSTEDLSDRVEKQRCFNELEEHEQALQNPALTSRESVSVLNPAFKLEHYERVNLGAWRLIDSKTIKYVTVNKGGLLAHEQNDIQKNIYASLEWRYLEKVRKALGLVSYEQAIPHRQVCLAPLEPANKLTVSADIFVEKFNAFFSEKGIVLSISPKGRGLKLALTTQLHASCWDEEDLTDSLINRFFEQTKAISLAPPIVMQFDSLPDLRDMHKHAKNQNTSQSVKNSTPEENEDTESNDSSSNSTHSPSPEKKSNSDQRRAEKRAEKNQAKQREDKKTVAKNIETDVKKVKKSTPQARPEPSKNEPAKVEVKEKPPVFKNLKLSEVRAKKLAGIPIISPLEKKLTNSSSPEIHAASSLKVERKFNWEPDYEKKKNADTNDTAGTVYLNGRYWGVTLFSDAPPSNDNAVSAILPTLNKVN